MGGIVLSASGAATLTKTAWNAAMTIRRIGGAGSIASRTQTWSEMTLESVGGGAKCRCIAGSAPAEGLQPARRLIEEATMIRKEADVSEPLISDEEIAGIWADGGSFNESARRIIALTRERLAERILGDYKQALSEPNSPPWSDHDESGLVEWAARIVAGEGGEDE